MPLPPTASDSSTWQGPSHLDVETMVWDMPIKVFATNPMYASSVSLLKTDVTGTLWSTQTSTCDRLAAEKILWLAYGLWFAHSKSKKYTELF